MNPSLRDQTRSTAAPSVTGAAPRSPRLFSIIISGYKNTLRETVEGCLRQAGSADVSHEVIVLDNTPDSRHRQMVQSLCDAAPDHVRTVYLPQPIPGKAAAQNRGIAEAKGDWCVFLDDDVLPDPELVLQYDQAAQMHEAKAIQGRVELHFEGVSELPSWFDYGFRLGLAEMDFGKVIVPLEMGLTGANMALHSSLFQSYGMFDERLGPGRSGTLEDEEFSNRIRKGGEVQIFWPGASVKHRISPDRLSWRAFKKINMDVGASNFFISRHLIAGGRFRLTLYTMRKALTHSLKSASALVRGNQARAMHSALDAVQAYAFWKQAMQCL